MIFQIPSCPSPKQLTTATPYLDKPNGTLIYVLKAVDRTDKLVIRVNYNAAGRFDGIKSNIRSNFVRTGGLVSPGDINPTDYELLKGGG